MKKRTYFICLAVVIAAMVLALGYGLVSGNPAVPAVITILGLMIIWTCHGRVTQVMEDDLSRAISGRAALAALEITIIVAAVLFAGTMTFTFNGGYGGGIHTYDNGSVRVSFMQFDTMTPGRSISEDSYLITDPAHMTVDDFWGIDRIFAKGHEMKDYPFAFGVAMGFIVVLLVGLYAAFSMYYIRKYEA